MNDENSLTVNLLLAFWDHENVKIPSNVVKAKSLIDGMIIELNKTGLESRVYVFFPNQGNGYIKPELQQYMVFKGFNLVSHAANGKKELLDKILIARMCFEVGLNSESSDTIMIITQDGDFIEALDMLMAHRKKVTVVYKDYNALNNKYKDGRFNLFCIDQFNGQLVSDTDVITIKDEPNVISKDETQRNPNYQLAMKQVKFNLSLNSVHLMLSAEEYNRASYKKKSKDKVELERLAELQFEDAD